MATTNALPASAQVAMATGLARDEDVRGLDTQNVGATERWGSLVGGGVIAVLGLARGGLGGLGLALVGGSLIHRGVTGNCMAYSALGVNTARGADQKGKPVRMAPGRGVRLEQTITIFKESGEVYAFWRNFSNLPRVMPYLEEVRVISDTQSHWIAKGPFGKRVEWDAEIYTERPGEMLAWRSLSGSQVDTVGSVNFRPAPGARGTEVTVNMKYDPPAGKVGAVIAGLTGESADTEVRESLRRLKQILEAGEAPTLEGQPRGACA